MTDIAPDELPPGAAEGPPALGKRLTSGRTILSFVIAFCLLGYVLYRQGPATLLASWEMIRHANPALYLLALATYYMAFPIRAARWRVLLVNSGEPRERLPGLPVLSGIIYLSWFVNSIVPAKLGDFYRGYLLRERSGTSWSHAMGTIVAERILDLVVLVSLMVTAGIFTYGDLLRQAVANGPGTCLRAGIDADSISCTLLQIFALGTVVAIALIVGLIVFARYGYLLEPHLPDRLAGIYQRFAAGLCLSFGRFPVILTLSVMAWLAEGTAFWLVGQSLGQHMPLPLVVFFSLLQAFITVIPVTPGGLGFEVLLAGALSVRGFSKAAAWAMTGLYRSISYLSLVIGGSLLYVFLQGTRRAGGPGAGR
jgi:glycosyltransferase 2 family protein